MHFWRSCVIHPFWNAFLFDSLFTLYTQNEGGFSTNEPMITKGYDSIFS